MVLKYIQEKIWLRSFDLAYGLEVLFVDVKIYVGLVLIIIDPA